MLCLYLYPTLDQIQGDDGRVCGATTEDAAEPAQQEELVVSMLARVTVCCCTQGYNGEDKRNA